MSLPCHISPITFLCSESYIHESCLTPEVPQSTHHSGMWSLSHRFLKCVSNQQQQTLLGICCQHNMLGSQPRPTESETLQRGQPCATPLGKVAAPRGHRLALVLRSHSHAPSSERPPPDNSFFMLPLPHSSHAVSFHSELLELL